MTNDDETEPEPERRASLSCYYLAGCRWPDGCDAEATCIGAEVEGVS